MTYERIDTGVVDDTGSPRHERDESLGEVEDGVNVGLENVFPLLIGQVKDGFNLVLSTGVVEQNINLAVEHFLGLFGEGLTFFLVGKVGRDRVDLSRGAVLLEVRNEIVHVLLFFLDIVQ